jgi:hypothetical protein
VPNIPKSASFKEQPLIAVSKAASRSSFRMGNFLGRGLLVDDAAHHAQFNIGSA